MLKIQNDSTKIVIEIEGYAYPFARDYWDANWLSVNVKIFNNINTSESELFYDNNDACLLTTELESLKAWFLSILDKNLQEVSQIEFMEPCISFNINRDYLYVLLKYNLNPKYEKDFESVYTLSFQLNKQIIVNLIKYVDNWIELFPERYSVNLKE
jgi:hypothetical protein